MRNQIFISDTKPKPSRVNPIVNRARSKPEGGFWTSPETGNSISPYERFESGALVQSDELVWRLVPKRGCNVVRVEDLDDLQGIPEHDPQDGIGRDTFIDFEELFSSGVDGLFVSGSVAHRKAFSNEYNLSGWDFDSVLWRDLSWVDTIVELGTVEELE